MSGTLVLDCEGLSAIDAMVAATALAAPPPRIVLTSGPQDLAALCGAGGRIVRA